MPSERQPYRQLCVVRPTKSGRAIFAPAVALKVDPNAPSQDDPYSDPKYQVPDDLTW